MHIIHVIPIARGIDKETLSYFSATDIEPGSLVKVPVRNRQVLALVVHREPANELKADLKSSSFAMRKLGKVKVMPVFSAEFLKAAEQAAEYFAGTTGSVLATVTPKPILEQADKVKKPEKMPEIRVIQTPDPYVLQADEDERLAHYKSLIREQFARKKSIYFCLPTIQDTKRVFETITKGIEDYTHVLNSSLTKKEILDVWNKVITEKHPVLIIGTGSFMGIPRPDIGLIVVERESSSGYKTHTRPYVDIRTFSEMYAKRINAKLIFGDLLLRTETLSRAKNGELVELAPLKFRSLSTSDTQVIDMKKYKTLDAPEFRILSEEFETLVKDTKDSNANMFIFAARRGLAPLTVCGDCGTTVLCTRCSAPIVLHKGGDESNFFLCHRCGERRSAEERCRVCTSWKLTTLGIGIELIEKAITSLFPDTTIYRMDKDTVSTHKQALSVMTKFYNSPGSILLGTEMALSYLEKPVENSAVASIDSLFSIPDFRINEKIMNILLKIRSVTQKTCIIQTRSRDQHIFDYATKGNLMDFYREEIDERKKLSYPPFATLIKITVKGTRQRVINDMNYVEKLLGDYEPLIFPAFIETINKKSVMHALIKLERNRWVSRPLLERLLQLPPHIAVNVDPESLL